MSSRRERGGGGEGAQASKLKVEHVVALELFIGTMNHLRKIPHKPPPLVRFAFSILFWVFISISLPSRRADRRAVGLEDERYF